MCNLDVGKGKKKERKKKKRSARSSLLVLFSIRQNRVATKSTPSYMYIQYLPLPTYLLWHCIYLRYLLTNITCTPQSSEDVETKTFLFVCHFVCAQCRCYATAPTDPTRFAHGSPCMRQRCCRKNPEHQETPRLSRWGTLLQIRPVCQSMLSGLCCVRRACVS